MLTLLTNMLYGARISDMETAYKVRVLFRYRVAPLERIVRGVEKGVPEEVS